MTTVVRPCPSCQHDVPDRYRRCGHCGNVVDAARPPEEIRRTVTIVTSDLKGSTALGERLDPESLRELLTRYFDEMRVVFESYGGTIEKIIGDAIFAIFGLPTRHDDDPLRGVAAAAESLRTLSLLNDQFEQAYGVRLVNRTGIASGEVVVGEASAGQHVLTGDTMRIATAMEQSSPPLEALLAPSTYELLRDDVEVEPIEPSVPKGMTAEIQGYRLVAVSAEAEKRLRAAGEGPTTDARICGNCGEENPTDFVHCGTCGAKLERTAPAPERRKTVTLVFADPRPTTASGERPSAEAMRAVMSGYFDTMKPILERHGGTVEKFIGDAVMAVYGLPVLHEDDAVRATRAASEMQEAIPALNERFTEEWGVWFENHIGVNTGEVIAGDASLGQRLVTGDAVNTAARLEQNAPPREVLLGDLTYQLARDAVQVEAVEPLTLKGKAEPVPAYRLVSVSAVEHTVRRRQDAPMVGREAEMTALTSLFSTAVDERRCRLATVIGDAGVGKSRLIAEFIARGAQGARVIRGRCLPYGDGITFWPLNEAARDAAGIGADDGAAAALQKMQSAVGNDDVADRLASVMGLSTTPYPVPEIYWGARKFLEHLAGARPVVMVIEDIHWAEATFLDLIGHLVGSVENVPVVLLCTGRHELLDRDPEWGEGEGAVRLVLRPLTDADAGQVVAGLLGGTGLPEAVQNRIVESAAGNPLFVEQLLSMLIDSGALRQTDGGWEQVRDLTALDVPPTIQALLAARLDLLEARERSVIEPASVIGQTFAQDAVVELVAADLAPEVADCLVTIDRKELVGPSPDSTPEEVAYRFAHVLIRDAAYNGLLKRARADFHERFVDWAEVLNLRQGRGQEFEEIHGYHLEQAYRYLTELGTVDDHARQVGIRASKKLASAGYRAWARGDAPAAVSLLRRAAATRSSRDPERLALLPELAEALQLLGEHPEAYQILNEAMGAAKDTGDARLAARVRLVELYIDLFSGKAGADWSSSVEHAVDEAIPIFETAGDEAGLTFAWRQRAGINMVANRNEEMAAAFEQVLIHARAARDRRTEARSAYALATALLYGPSPVAEAVPRCEELAEASAADQSAAALIQAALAQLYSMQGRLADAKRTIGAAHARLLDLGASVDAATALIGAGYIELRADDPAAAERELRRGYESLTALGEKFVLPTVGGLLARALVLQGRIDDAAPILSAMEGVAAPQDVDAQAILHGVRARLLALEGRADGALEAASKAVELRGQSDSPALLADALIDQGAVLRALGDAQHAVDSWGRARDLLARKGDVVSVARLGRLLSANG